MDAAGRNALKLDPTFLTKVSKCLNHPELLKIGIDEDFLVDIAKSLKEDFAQAGKKIEIEGIETTLTTSKAKLLEDEIFDIISGFGDFLKLNKPSEVGNLDVVLSRLKGSLFSQRKGAVGVLKFLQEPSTAINGKKLNFEISVPNNRPTNANSYIDVTVDGIKYEIKYCGDCITSKTILNQFIQRDLFNATSINDITKWKVYDQNYLKNDLVGHLTNNKSAIEDLGFTKINQLFGTTHTQFTSKSKLSETVINWFSELSNYNQIYK